MTIQEQVWKVGKWVGILLVVFLAVLSIKALKETSYVGRNVPIMNSISVQGKGEAISIPDIATFSFTVNETAKTVKEAQDKATEQINGALAAVKAGGVDDKDIKTLSYNINPHYEYVQGVCTVYGCPGKSVLTGYDVSQTIEVKVRDLTKAGELFDTIGAAGIQNVNGLTFGIDDIDSVKAIARADAIANAQEKAQKIAKELGVRLVKVSSFYDSSDDMYSPYYSARPEMAMGGDVANMSVKSPSIPTGQQKVTATVSVTYEIR